VAPPQVQAASANPAGPEEAETIANRTVALPPIPAQGPPAAGEHEHEQEKKGTGVETQGLPAIPAWREQDQEHEHEGEVKPAKPHAIVLSSVLGTIDLLSEAEQADYFACQEVLGMGWNAVVDAGLALARIRDGRLYREEFDSFEAFCQAKWEYGRRYVNRLICAAQIFRKLGTGSSLLKPERETQVRPLVGLAPEQVQLAWERAVQKATGGRITERLVKKAVQELQLAGPAKPVAKEQGPTKAERRRLIDDTFGQLLALVSRKADHRLMQEKIEILHGHVQSLFATKPRR
jgi:hypothetical protein